MILSVVTENYNNGSSEPPPGVAGHHDNNKQLDHHGNQTFYSTYLHDNTTYIHGNQTITTNETQIPLYYESTTEKLDENENLIFINGNSIFKCDLIFRKMF